MTFNIEQLWTRFGFVPNDEQEQAIRHTEGPLFLTAGPGSGKTRTLLWRTVNLIVFHNVPPEKIYLATFTEKAARQLRLGLTVYLTEASKFTGRFYDLSRMLLGTVHSTCRRILADRRFCPHYQPPQRLVMLDELDQYFWLLDHWWELVTTTGSGALAAEEITEFMGQRSSSRHEAVACLQQLFNRFSEECLQVQKVFPKIRNATLRTLLDLYTKYCAKGAVDLSLLQVRALDQIRRNPHSSQILQYLIIDEYQDTNYVQEQLFFQLAKGSQNLCVVGDDDQAIYRFRGSTVENLVQFPKRCRQRLGVAPTTINLAANYRSRPAIIHFYTSFMDKIDWRKPGKSQHYRIMNKKIIAHRSDDGPAVVVTRREMPQLVCQKVARLVRKLINQGKVADPNQIAFVYPSLQSAYVKRMITALEDEGLRVYAPRAGRFLETPEALSVMGLFQLILKRFQPPDKHPVAGFQTWLDQARKEARAIAREDRMLARFLAEKEVELRIVARDYHLLERHFGRHWDELLTDDHAEKLRRLNNLSDRARAFVRRTLPRLLTARRTLDRQPTVNYVIARITTLDWGLLDLFYQLMGFKHFKRAFDWAQRGEDEGPICNLAMVSRYLARYQSRRSSLIG
ncbi:MAG: hypothetical protein KatS3mg109_0294 [Pirellulaceae bacterium]|nr:MAG: hypothetical protein KatS3mg109_0294 [Pirellulaceae bacterium]